MKRKSITWIQSKINQFKLLSIPSPCLSIFFIISESCYPTLESREQRAESREQRERHRERDRERQRDRERHRERHRERDTERETQREREATMKAFQNTNQNIFKTKIKRTSNNLKRKWITKKRGIHQTE